MKHFFRKAVFLIAIGVSLAGCSSDGTNQASTVGSNVQNMNTARTAASIYPEFSTLFATLYGTSYDISNTSTVVPYDGVSYRYTEVYNTSRTRTLQGYFLEMPGNVLYLEHISATGTLNQYDWNGSTYVQDIFNLRNDPNYARYGFTPAQPSGATGKFWGTQQSNGMCGHNSNGDGGCSYGVYDTYYVFWIATGPAHAHLINGHPETHVCTGC